MQEGRFVLKSPFKPQGDQPQAIEALAQGVQSGMPCQVLLGVTGSGKTYTMASVIERVQRPTLVIAHNKTLAAQLCAEFREFFPDSAVEYFVSYYDYYQPEAYIASTDTYIEKDSAVNEEIERLRHSATAALRERRDVIVVASVSCIYSMGDPSEYEGMMISLRPGMAMARDELIRQLVDIQYDRSDIEFERGTFRVRGDVVEIFPAGYDKSALRVEFFGDEIDRISAIDVVSGHTLMVLEHISIYPATHYATPREAIDRAIGSIEHDLDVRIREFKEKGDLIEAQRIAQRTQYDIEMLRELGYCTGIENYSRYFDGRQPGDAPFTWRGLTLTLIDGRPGPEVAPPAGNPEAPATLGTPTHSRAPTGGSSSSATRFSRCHSPLGRLTCRCTGKSVACPGSIPRVSTPSPTTPRCTSRRAASGPARRAARVGRST